MKYLLLLLALILTSCASIPFEQWMAEKAIKHEILFHVEYNNEPIYWVTFGEYRTFTRTECENIEFFFTFCNARYLKCLNCEKISFYSPFNLDYSQIRYMAISLLPYSIINREKIERQKAIDRLKELEDEIDGKTLNGKDWIDDWDK